MNITKNQIDDLNATLKIELGKEDYAERVEKTLKDYQKKVTVKGFRPGKTPMGMVKKLYGKSLLVEEINKVLAEGLSNYVKENNLQLLGDPLPNETEQVELDLESEHFEFCYDIAFAPEVNAKMSKREKIPYYVVKVDDEMIDKQIENICKNNGKMMPVDEIEGSEYLKGELIELDENGGAKEGGIRNEEASMSLHYMKDEEALEAFKGKKPGEEVKFNAAKSFPNKTDFAAMLGVSKEDAEQAGENYCFIINSIERYIDAEVNEELFTRLYGEDVVKDVNDFRERVKAEVANQLKGHSEYRFRVDAKEKMVKKNEGIVLPEEFMKRWIYAMNSDKFTPEEVEKDFDMYRQGFIWQLIEAAIVKEYNLSVEEEDLLREARLMAASQLQQYGLYGLTNEQLDSFAEKLLQDQKQCEYLFAKAKEDKVYEVIHENMKLEEQEISMADFEKLFQR